MKGARAEILGKIKASLGTIQDNVAREQAAHMRIAHPPRHVIPKRTQIGKSALLNLFREMAEEVAATTSQIDCLQKLPAEVANYLAQHNLPTQLKTDTNSLLANVDWGALATLEVRCGKAENHDHVSVTAAFAGVAETGTVVLTSGVTNPTTLNFLPENHIVVLPTSRLYRTYEDVWEQLRKYRAQNDETLPRTVNWITGPSRTGDIEQTMQLGLHGPRRLHLILVNDDG